MKSEVDWMDIRERYPQGETISQIARELGMDRKTVRRYAQIGAPLEHAGRGGSQLDAHKEYIVGRLKLHPLSAVRILEEIRERGYTGGYTSVKEFMRPLRNDRAIAAELRFETPPGEQAQVDWVDFGRVQLDGQTKHLHGFVMVLGYSRMDFVVFTTDVTMPTFITCHMGAFGYFSGYTDTILYDNTKNVVLKCHGQLKINRFGPSEINHPPPPSGGRGREDETRSGMGRDAGAPPPSRIGMQAR